MTDSKKMAVLAYDALEDKKGVDITVLDISTISPIADYFIIASGDNERQVGALADAVDEALGRAGFERRALEGANTPWILMDYNDVIVHVFNQADREFYNLERLWRDAKHVTREELN